MHKTILHCSGIIPTHSLSSSLICPLLSCSCLVSSFRPSSLVRGKDSQGVTDRKWTISFKIDTHRECRSEIPFRTVHFHWYTRFSGKSRLHMHHEKMTTHGCLFGHYLSQCKVPWIIFKRVPYGSQLSELGEVRKRLQPADGSFQFLLIFYDEKLQQAEHLQDSEGCKDETEVQEVLKGGKCFYQTETSVKPKCFKGIRKKGISTRKFLKHETFKYIELS